MRGKNGSVRDCIFVVKLISVSLSLALSLSLSLSLSRDKCAIPRQVPSWPSRDTCLPQRASGKPNKRRTSSAVRSYAFERGSFMFSLPQSSSKTRPDGKLCVPKADSFPRMKPTPLSTTCSYG